MNIFSFERCAFKLLTQIFVPKFEKYSIMEKAPHDYAAPWRWVVKVNQSLYRP